LVKDHADAQGIIKIIASAKSPERKKTFEYLINSFNAERKDKGNDRPRSPEIAGHWTISSPVENSSLLF
jgi:hypothetical protein